MVVVSLKASLGAFNVPPIVIGTDHVSQKEKA